MIQIHKSGKDVLDILDWVDREPSVQFVEAKFGVIQFDSISDLRLHILGPGSENSFGHPNKNFIYWLYYLTLEILDPEQACLFKLQWT